MNIYHWITIILIADIALILFVRGSDERRQDRKRETKLGVQ
jgi:hypothetical protein